MAKSVIYTSSAPEAVGAYSQAIAANGFVFCSGQVALDPSSGELVGDTVGEQTKRVMDNLGAVLAEAGSDFSSVVKVSAWLADMGDFPEFNEVYGSYFDSDPPARATIGIAALPRGALVEVECVALAK